MNIRKTHNLPPITLHTVLPRADKIKISVGSLFFLSATKVSSILIGVVEKLEEILAMWNGD